MSNTREISHSLEIYKQLFEQVRFAYTKAQLILAWHGASIGFLSLFFINILKHKDISCLGKIILSCFFSLSLVFALISVYISFQVIAPKLTDKKCMFWIYHISCGDFEEDLKRFKRNIENDTQILSCLARSIINLANILKEKDENLNNSLKYLQLALIFEIIFLLTIPIEFLLKKICCS